ncbi:HAD family hydrolase [soil metagenome]
MSVRLVATDLDGTLLRSDGTVSAGTRRVLAAVEDAGIPVVFVTARPLRWMDDLWALVGAHGLAVVSNGAVLFDVAQREVRSVRGLDPAAGLAVAAAVRAAVPHAQLAIETLDGIRLEATYDEPEHVPPGSPVGPLEEIWDVVAVKLLVRRRRPGGPEEEAAFREAVTTAVGDAGITTWSVPGLMEISAPGVTKAAALARLCEEAGVAAADVLAFGDMPNDLAMLTWAGTSYAVANAHHTVSAAADHTTAGNDDDGVARVLARLVPGGLDLL